MIDHVVSSGMWYDGLRILSLTNPASHIVTKEEAEPVED